MFLAFFYALRVHGIPVTPTEWLALLEVLLRHSAPDARVLYHVARAVCVKHEELFDAFDAAFLEVFGDAVGVGAASGGRGKLTGAAFLQAIEAGDMKKLAELGLDLPPELAALLLENREALARMAAEADTEMEGGIRNRQPGGAHSAIAMARRRRFRNYRSDMVLDTRSIRVALSRLRRRLPTGPVDELDLDASIDRTCREGGEIELVYRRRRKNHVKIVLLMDAGGTMTPHARLVNRLFSAARSQFEHFKAYYFHNCPYDQVYEDIERRVTVSTEKMLEYGRDHWLIVVGDAHMGTPELIVSGRNLEGPRCEEPGLVWLQRIHDAFRKSVWLNPVEGAESFSSGHSVMLVQSVFDMLPLTLDGLDAAMAELMSGRRR